MISRWDAVVNYLAHTGRDGIPHSIHFQCERCGCRIFLQIRESIEHADPVLIVRTYALECMECGLQEISVIHTVLIGGQGSSDGCSPERLRDVLHGGRP